MPSNFGARGVYFNPAEPSRPGHMKLNLQPYDPAGDLRGRAESALMTLAAEWNAAPPPPAGDDRKNDQEERNRAAARKWRRTSGGRENNRRRMAARRDEKRAARAEAMRGN